MNILFLLKPKITVSYIYGDYTLKQGLTKMQDSGYSALPVLSREGYYMGTVREGDFLWHIMNQDIPGSASLDTFLIEDIMSPDRNSPVRISATMDELLLRVMDQNFVPVVDDRDLFMGIVTRRDVMKSFYKKQITAKSQSRIMNTVLV